MPNPRPRVLSWILTKFEMVHDDLDLHLPTLNVDQKNCFTQKVYPNNGKKCRALKIYQLEIVWNKVSQLKRGESRKHACMDIDV